MIRKAAPDRSADPEKIAITFELPADIWAEQVALIGEFNNWDPAANQLVQERDGVWRLLLHLDRHRQYAFRYLLNGSESLNEWPADDYVPDRAGGFSSVLRT
jgi:1,4-alpha-glucan branching enzyme